ncbi:TetR family transcriptional regulator, partial [Rhizobiaceae sp. 2RAB30]
NNARHVAMTEYEAAIASGTAHSLTRLMETLIRPMVKLSRDPTGGRALISLLLQARASPAAPDNMLGDLGSDVFHERFIAALGKILPDLNREEIIWRYDCARGAMMFILADLSPGIHRIVQLAGSPEDATDETIVEELVAFTVAGFMAASANTVLAGKAPMR